jgi:hypothetical protein
MGRLPNALHQPTIGHVGSSLKLILIPLFRFVASWFLLPVPGWAGQVKRHVPGRLGWLNHFSGRDSLPGLVGNSRLLSTWRTLITKYFFQNGFCSGTTCYFMALMHENEHLSGLVLLSKRIWTVWAEPAPDIWAHFLL